MKPVKVSLPVVELLRFPEALPISLVRSAGSKPKRARMRIWDLNRFHYQHHVTETKRIATIYSADAEVAGSGSRLSSLAGCDPERRLRTAPTAGHHSALLAQWLR